MQATFADEDCRTAAALGSSRSGRPYLPYESAARVGKIRFPETKKRDPNQAFTTAPNWLSSTLKNN
jgi:hypothetical protein